MNVKHYQPIGFSERLYNAWIASGIDLADLSRRTGIRPNGLYGYMYYGTTPNITYLGRLCEALKVSADYLLFGRGEDPVLQDPEPPKKRLRIRLLTYQGETLSVTDWSKKLGISRSTIHYRLGMGLSIDEVLKVKEVRT